MNLILPVISTLARRASAGDISPSTTEFHLENVPPKTVSRYLKVLALGREHLPLSFYYLFAQRAHIAQMISPSFPFPVLGMIHLSNEMESFKEVKLSQRFVLSSTISQLENCIYFAVDFKQDGEIVMTCKSTYLIANRKSKSERVTATKNEEAEFDYFCEVDLESGDGRKYAIASGDFNFIHLHPLLAKVFGFKKAIIHGMFMCAKVNGLIEQSLEKPIKYFKIEFKKPIFLPSKVLIKSKHGHFQVTSNKDDRLHLFGEYKV